MKMAHREMDGKKSRRENESHWMRMRWSKVSKSLREGYVSACRMCFIWPV
jgi:hypothetical protein